MYGPCFFFLFFLIGEGGLLDPNSKKEVLSHERVFPSSLWSKAVTLFGKKEKKKAMGWNKDYEFVCISQPLVLLSATLVYTSVDKLQHRSQWAHSRTQQ